MQLLNYRETSSTERMEADKCRRLNISCGRIATKLVRSAISREMGRRACNTENNIILQPSASWNTYTSPYAARLGLMCQPIGLETRVYESNAVVAAGT